MPDYQMMYKVLFQTMTHCIEAMQKAQLTTEEMYVSSEEPIIKVFPSNSGNENKDGDCKE